METKIGINIICENAKEQFIIQNESEAIYYEDSFAKNIKDKCSKIIKNHTDCNFSISYIKRIIKDKYVKNTILFRIYNIKNINKKLLKKELEEYITDYFKLKFKE